MIPDRLDHFPDDLWNFPNCRFLPVLTPCMHHQNALKIQEMWKRLWQILIFHIWESEKIGTKRKYYVPNLVILDFWNLGTSKFRHFYFWNYETCKFRIVNILKRWKVEDDDREMINFGLKQVQKLGYEFHMDLISIKKHETNIW